MLKQIHLVLLDSKGVLLACGPYNSFIAQGIPQFQHIDSCCVFLRSTLNCTNNIYNIGHFSRIFVGSLLNNPLLINCY